VTRTFIRNIGEIFTGDIAGPMSGAKTLLIEDGRIAAFDPADPENLASACDVVIDARDGALLPGLVDGHIHPVFGEWSPTQGALGWIGNYVHGGTTTLVSAGEVHVPGLDYGNLSADLVTSLAVVTAQTTGRIRWSGAKVHAGTVLLVPGMREEHFDRLAAAGSKFAKFIFYPLDKNPEEAKRYVAWCRARGIRVKVHTGGASGSGASVTCGFDILSWLQPDVAAHISGGPIPMSDADLDAVIERTKFALEICVSGSYGSTKRAVRRLSDKEQLGRLTLGTDTPGANGVAPRALMREIMFLTSVCGISPGTAVAIATGNTAKAHGLDVGLLIEGRPADIVVCAPVSGSTGKTVADAIAHGDLPGISHVLIDGEIVVAGKSRQTPPPKNPAHFVCCNVGWMTQSNGFPRAEA
jgi:enamidase